MLFHSFLSLDSNFLILYFKALIEAKFVKQVLIFQFLLTILGIIFMGYLLCWHWYTKQSWKLQNVLGSKILDQNKNGLALP